MKHRWLAGLLCLAFSLSAFPIVAADNVDATEPAGYVLYEMDYRVNGSQAVNAGGGLFSAHTVFSKPVDFTQMGYSEDPEENTLGLQLDLFIAGEENFVQRVIENTSAQIEFTSSGRADKEEIYCSGGKLNFKKDKWVRQVIPLSDFAQFNRGTSTDPHLDPTVVDYFRIYKAGFSPETEVNKSCIIRICNVRLVDMSKADQAPPLSEDPIGDGSFTAAAPEWKAVPANPQYNRDDVVVAGYNLKQYLTDHNITGVTDYAPIIQSLLDGLGSVGGGVLYIPAGEYPCYRELNIPTGCTIYGDWQSPDVAPAIGGTILKVYGGRNEINGTPFITMGSNSKIQNVTFWYPEQTAEAVVPYPPAVKTATYTFVENVTFVNAYYAIEQGPGNAFCPTVTNVYGTPLSVGMDMDGVTDVGRFDEIHFAPDYWITSGLPGAPASEPAAEELRTWLLEQATAIVLRRIDWSYLANVTVKGYAEGLIFRESYYASCFENGVRVSYNFPNGQCYNLYFEDCGTALFAYGVARNGEMVTGLTAKNCENGVVVSSYADNDPEGHLQLIDADITATKDAVRVEGRIQITMMDSVIRSGVYRTTSGHHTLTANQFLTQAPQIVLEGGTRTVVATANTDKDGNAVTVDNQGHCPQAIDQTPIVTPDVPTVDLADIGKQVRKPTANTVRVAEGLDSTGATDVTAALQAQLNALASTGGTLYLPAGIYKLDSTVSITVPSGVQLLGACDFGRIGYKCGTILNVYGGRGAADGAPTFILSEQSGMRGLMVNYPEQYQNLTFEAYPYFIQGRGADVWITNVSIRNGYNGFDLMTYRCDNHYVDYVAGICVNNFLAVGGGSVGGTVRNYQVNYNALENGSADYYGSWEALPITIADFSPRMRDYLRRNAVICRVGDVEDQIFYNSFNYSGYSGVEFVEEASGSADALLIGHGIDYGTVAIDVKAAESLTFLNLQTTSFVYSGEEYLPGMTNVALADTFTGTVDMVGVLTWAQTESVFRVEGGTLSVYGLGALQPNTSILSAKNKGTASLVAVCLRPVGSVENIPLGSATALSLNSGIYSKEIEGSADCPVYKNLLPTVDRWDAPSGVQIGDDGEMVYAEAFTGYGSLKEDERLFQMEGEDGAVEMRTGQVRITLNNYSVAAGVRNKNIPLDKAGLYRLEMRLNVASMLQGIESKVVVTLGNQDATLDLVRFAYDGGFFVNNEHVGTFETGKWYRVAAEIDTRTPGAYTYRVFLMDNAYKVLAQSDTVSLPAALQGAGTVLNDLLICAFGDTDPDDSNETRVQLDWVCLSRADTSSFEEGNMLGDVSGDNKVDSTDARLVLQYAVKKIPATSLDLTVADVSGDGKVDSTDARLVLQYAVKKIQEFPAG